jgi:mono/diheme cytochrome c family protein
VKIGARLAIAALTLVLAACQHSEAQVPASADMIADGRAVAESQCGRCHALDRGLSSPRPDAPPFSVIAQRYKFPVLEEELIEGVKLGHPDMPQFQFPPRGVDALIAYLRSVQGDARGTDGPP